MSRPSSAQCQATPSWSPWPLLPAVARVRNMHPADDDETDYAAIAGFDFHEVPQVEDLLSTASLRAQLSQVRLASSSVFAGDRRAPASAAATDAASRPTCDPDDAPLPDLVRRYADDFCTTLVVAFGGLMQSSGGVPSHEFVKALTRAGATHTLFVKDSKQAWYLLGLSDGEASFGAVIAAVRTECDVLQPERLVTVGASMGGYAAIRVGLALGASTVLAFAPQVFLQRPLRQILQLPSSSFDTALAAAAVACAASGVEMPSLTAYVGEVGAGDVDCAAAPKEQRRWHARACDVSTVELHVGSAAKGDVREAMLLRQAASLSRPLSIRVHVHHNLAHALVRDLRSTGELDSLLRGALVNNAALAVAYDPYCDPCCLLYGLTPSVCDGLVGASPREGANYASSLDELQHQFFTAQQRSQRREDAGSWSDDKVERKRRWSTMGVAPAFLVPTLFSCALEVDPCAVEVADSDAAAEVVETEDGGFAPSMETAPCTLSPSDERCESQLLALLHAHRAIVIKPTMGQRVQGVLVLSLGDEPAIESVADKDGRPRRQVTDVLPALEPVVAPAQRPEETAQAAAAVAPPAAGAVSSASSVCAFSPIKNEAVVCEPFWRYSQAVGSGTLGGSEWFDSCVRTHQELRGPQSRFLCEPIIVHDQELCVLAVNGGRMQARVHMHMHMCMYMC